MRNVSFLPLSTSKECGAVRDEPGFDKDHWPSMADEKWGTTVYHYYNREPYWTATRDISEGRETDI